MSGCNTPSASMAQMELENMHLKEAIQYAQRGWEDALQLLNKNPDIKQNEQSSLEIRSLQMELDALHKNMLTKSQHLSSFKDGMVQAIQILQSEIDEIKDFIRYPEPEEDPSIAPPMEELIYGLDSNEEQVNKQLIALNKAVEQLGLCKDFIVTSSEPYDNGELKPHTHKAAASHKKATKKKVVAKK
jgi:hypothetical protein